VRAYCLTRLTDAVLLADLAEMVERDCATTAEVLAYLAEADARRLFLGVGYASLYVYCIDKLQMSEDVAYKRIQAARVCRRFPQIFVALARGRLHLAAVCLLAPYLTPENADELIALASHRRKWEIETRLAARFPRTERMTLVEVHAASAAPIDTGARASAAPVDASPPVSPQGVAGNSLPAPGQVENDKAHAAASRDVPVVRAASDIHAPETAPAPSPADPPARVLPVATQRFALQVMLGQGTYDKLRHALALLSHTVPEHDVAEVLDRALDVLIRQLERRRLGAEEPRSSRKAAKNRRHVPASVRRAVWKRDGGRCTFVGENGHRCEERRFLEFDHVDPVALGGRASVDRIRLRCRAHNQYEAERVFGAKLMNERRGRSITSVERGRSSPDQEAIDPGGYDRHIR
jgi:5-methylcytosine-specific restriction endonuclease McrA